MSRTVDSIDWNKLWMDALSAWTNSPELEPGRGGMGCSNMWNKADAAFQYDQTARLNNCASAKEKIGKMAIKPNYTVLDIGAGPGTLAIPLSGKVKKITAIEPAPGMIECLKTHISKEGIENIVCINKKWEDVSTDDISRHDVVIASFSLYMRDLREALLKMDSFASRHVYIFWNVGRSDWVKYYQKLWPEVHGTDYVPAPEVNYVYNILYNMGIYANVKVGTLFFGTEYQTLDEAVAVFKAFVHAETSEQELTLRRCLPNLLIQKENGFFSLPDGGKYPYAMIWWDKNQGQLD